MLLRRRELLAGSAEFSVGRSTKAATVKRFAVAGSFHMRCGRCLEELQNLTVVFKWVEGAACDRVDVTGRRLHQTKLGVDLLETHLVYLPRLGRYPLLLHNKLIDPSRHAEVG